MKTKFGSIALAFAIPGILGAGSVLVMAEGEVKAPATRLPASATTTLSADSLGGPDAADAPEEEEDDGSAEREAAFEEAMRARQTPAGDDDFLPPSYQLQRYAATWSNSPFDREILPPQKEEVKIVNPLNDYRVVGIGKIRGKYLVTIVDKKNAFKTIRSTPDSEGFVVKSVTDGRDPRSAKVVISDGNQTAEIGFDEKRLTAAPKGSAAPKVPVKRTNTPQRNVPGRTGVPAKAQTPQQAQAQAKANEALVKHLKQAAAKSGTNNASSGATPPKRRRVVLPPTNR